jgi:hypothetical protein
VQDSAKFGRLLLTFLIADSPPTAPARLARIDALIMVRAREHYGHIVTGIPRNDSGHRTPVVPIEAKLPALRANSALGGRPRCGAMTARRAASRAQHCVGPPHMDFRAIAGPGA